VDLSASWLPWWHERLCAQDFLKMIVLGARKTGKSTFFRWLADQPAAQRPVPHRVVYWPVRRLARLRDADEVWADLYRTLGLSADLVASGDEWTDKLSFSLEGSPESAVLVVDDWDGALDVGGQEIGESVYEVLDALCRFVVGQARPSGSPTRLGIVLLTSLPDSQDLKNFARTVQRPAFERLSDLVCRQMDDGEFPHLRRDDALAFLRQRGLAPEVAEEVADDCGGWLGLLELAADAAEEWGGWTAHARRRVTDELLPSLLRTALFPVLSRRAALPKTRDAAFGYLAERFADDSCGDRFGFPSAFDGAVRPPLIDSYRLRRYLVVDTENIRMAYRRDWEDHPERYDVPIREWLPRQLTPVVRRLARDYGVPDKHVVMVGRSEERISETVGAELGARRLFVDAGARRQSTKDGTDDLLLSSWIAKQEGASAQSHFLLLTGDQDAPVALRGLVGRLTVLTPWAAAKVLTENDLPPGWAIQENCLRDLPAPRQCGHSPRPGRGGNHR
jgi:hypothetical protein